MVFLNFILHLTHIGTLARLGTILHPEDYHHDYTLAALYANYTNGHPVRPFQYPFRGLWDYPLETPYNSHAGTSPGTTLPHCLPCRTIHIHWAQNYPPALYYISIYLSNRLLVYFYFHIRHHPSNIYGNWHHSS